MGSYLYNKFKDQYRVYGHYDLTTNDFPRTETGALDPSYDDFYIPSTKYKLEVHHGIRNNLTAYCFNGTQLNNILYKMCEGICGKKYERSARNNLLVPEVLKQNSVITDYEILDGEGYFSFKTEDMSVIAPYLKLKAKTTQKPISPLSKRNLPKSKYTIPEDEELMYNTIKNKYIDTYNFEAIDIAQIARQANKEFEEKFTNAQKIERKELAMNVKQYASYIHMWDKYLKLIENNFEDYAHYKKNTKGKKK